jgi:hypothetical protein
VAAPPRALGVLAAVVAILAWAAVSRCEDGPSPGAPGPPAIALATGVPGGSLSAHEGVEGGHPVSRHVGKSDDDLRRRLSEPGVRTASTFPDLATADVAVGEVLRRRSREVAGWLERGPRGLRDFRATLDRPVGRVLRQGDARPVTGRTAVAVLAPSGRFPEGFRVHTAYVETP